MKVALVHDYIKEYGGAERVLEALTEVFPQSPIYTAFCQKDSTAYEHFKNKKIITSWVQNIPFFASKLHSPLRFLAPLIWGSFEKEFSQYDVVISSASWYVTKGFGSRTFHSHPELVSGSKSPRVEMPKSIRQAQAVRGSEEPSGSERDPEFTEGQVRHDIKRRPIEICYCHTPPRWLYGYATAVNFQKIPIIKVYAKIVGHFMRLYDFKQAQKVDYFIANSKEVADRIKKLYRRDAKIIYPPVFLPKNRSAQRGDYYFIVSRIVGGKGLDIAVEASLKAGFKLKIAGSPAGYYFEHNKLVKKSQGKVEFLGQVEDDENLAELYAGAKAFLALAQDEDFGITPVEAMLCGTAVIAYAGGGYKETVIDGKTGVLFNEITADGLIFAIKKFEKMNIKREDCINQAQKFSKERFKKEIKKFVESKLR